MSNGILHEGVVEHRNFWEAGAKVKLVRGQKGSYGWEITITENNLLRAMEKLHAADAELKGVYGGNQNE